MLQKTPRTLPGSKARAIRSADPSPGSPHTRALDGIPPGERDHPATGSCASLLLHDRQALAPGQLSLVEDAVSVALEELGREWGLPL